MEIQEAETTSCEIGLGTALLKEVEVTRKINLKDKQTKTAV